MIIQFIPETNSTRLNKANGYIGTKLNLKLWDPNNIDQQEQF